MGAENILPQKGIKITLAGEEKTLRFTMKSMAVLAEKYGNVTSVLELFTCLAGGNMTAKELYGLADLVSASMISCDKNMTPEYICDNYDVDDLVEVVPSVVNAFLLAMGAKAKTEGSIDPQKV